MSHSLKTESFPKTPQCLLGFCVTPIETNRVEFKESVLRWIGRTSSVLGKPPSASWSTMAGWNHACWGGTRSCSLPYPNPALQQSPLLNIWPKRKSTLSTWTWAVNVSSPFLQISPWQRQIFGSVTAASDCQWNPGAAAQSLLGQTKELQLHNNKDYKGCVKKFSDRQLQSSKFECQQRPLVYPQSPH